MVAYAAVLSSKGAGCHARLSPKNLCEIVIIADSNRLGHRCNGLIASDQQQLGSLYPALGNDMRKGLPTGEPLCQRTQLGTADVQII